MPLTVAPTDCDLKIVKIVAEDKLKKHLENLGITPGAVIRMLSASGGSVICMIKDCKLAIDSNLSSHIFVKAARADALL